jgi:hypothetical protein
MMPWMAQLSSSSLKIWVKTVFTLEIQKKKNYLECKFTFIRNRKARLIVLKFAVASYNVLNGAFAEFFVDDFGQNCVELIKNKILELK